MRKVFSIFAAMLVALVANANVININTGTQDALRKAVAGASSGDIIVMAAGTYVESNSDYIAFHGKDVTVMAEDGAEVIVQPKVPIRFKNGGVARFINIKFDCGHLSDLGSYDNIIVPADGTEGKKLFLEGCEFYGFTQNNSIIHTRTDRQLDSVVINNCYFHDNMKSCVFLEYATLGALIITNTTFANIATNTTGYSAGVIDVRATSGSVRIDHCTFYNVQAMNTDYAAIGKIKTTDAVVSNCVFAMPDNTDNLRAIHMEGGEANNCLVYNYIKDDGYGIRSAVTKNNCITGQDPLFLDAPNGDLRIAGSSPVLGAATDGSDLGDPRWIPTMEYYLVGSLSGWTADPLFKLAKNPENDDEYMISLFMLAGVEFKIVKSDGITIADTDWYPTGMGNNYQITASAEYTVHFRPDGQGGEGWHEGYILAEAADLGPWESWFGDDSWNQETYSYITYNEATDDVFVHIMDDKNAQWQAQVKYKGDVKAEDGKCYHVSFKMMANNDVNGVTVKWQDDNNQPNVIFENQTINLAAEEQFVYDAVVAGAVGEQGSSGVLVFDFGWAHEDDIIVIYDVVIEETDCPEPPTYYLAGSMTEWAAKDEYMFVESTEVAGEYTVDVNLEAGTSIKVVGISEGEETWYPGGIGKEYVIDAAHAGQKTVYFRPAGNPDWADFGGYFYIEATLGVDNLNADSGTEKFIRNGQVLIRRNGETYNILAEKVE